MEVFQDKVAGPRRDSKPGTLVLGFGGSGRSAYGWISLWAEPQGLRSRAQVSDPKLFPVEHVRVGCRYPAPTLPGLGVEVDEVELMKLEFEVGRGDLFLRRDDGSVTNW
jgi:hypothetical protein